MNSIDINLQEVFQALSDPTRIRIARLLAHTGEEACLCELVDSLKEPKYKLSRHLKFMLQAGLLSAEKDDRWVFHRLMRGAPHLDRLRDLLKALPDSDNLFANDLANFQSRMCLRENGRCREDIQTKRLALEEWE